MSFKPGRVVPLNVLSNQIVKLNELGSKQYWRLQTSKLDDSKTEQRLEADYKFKSFAKTWEFLNMVALKAATLKHHPTIITTYNKVNLQITTHDVGNLITYDDLKLASAVHDEFVDKFSSAKSKTPTTTEGEPNNDLSNVEKTSQLIDDLINKP